LVAHAAHAGGGTFETPMTSVSIWMFTVGPDTVAKRPKVSGTSPLRMNCGTPFNRPVSEYGIGVVLE
jgi:hypothetical protein